MKISTTKAIGAKLIQNPISAAPPQDNTAKTATSPKENNSVLKWPWLRWLVRVRWLVG